MKKKYLFIWMLAGLVPAAGAQTPVRLTAAEAVSAAVSGNTAMKIAQLDEKIARSNYRQTEAIFLPQAGVSYTAMTTNNPLNAFGLRLQQKNITAADFNPATLNHPGAYPDFNTQLTVQQPLLNLDMMNQRKAAAKQVEMYGLVSQRTREHLAFETRKAYMQLQLLYAADGVLKEAKQALQSLYKNVQDYHRQGMVQKSDLLNAEVQLLGVETQLSQSKSNIGTVSDMLSMLMGHPAGALYQVDTLVLATAAADSFTFNASRADFAALRKGMEATDQLIAATRAARMPRVNAFGTWQLNDNRVLGFGANAWMVGLQVSWSLFNGNRTSHTLQRQQLEKERMQQQLVQQEEEARLRISQSARQLEDARFALRQQQLATEQSAEALRVLQNRFSQGLVKTTDVLMAQTQWSQQRLAYVQAVYQFNLSVATLQFQTQTSNNNP